MEKSLVKTEFNVLWILPVTGTPKTEEQRQVRWTYNSMYQALFLFHSRPLNRCVSRNKQRAWNKLDHVGLRLT